MNTPVKFYNSAFITGLFLINLLFTVSCSSSNPTNTNANGANKAANNKTSGNNANPVKDDITELLNIIRLPEVPEEAMWKEETLGKQDGRVPGPTDKKLIAVLKYTPENAAKIVALVEKNKTPEPSEVSAESWFPEELIAQSQLSGNESLKGISYGANDFFNIPYGTGRITRIENTDYFVLELMTT